MCQEENEEMENMKRWRKTRPVVGVCLPHHKQKENFAIFFCGCLFASEYKRAKTEGRKCHAKNMMSIKPDKTIKENPGCAAEAEHGGIKTREGVKSGV